MEPKTVGGKVWLKKIVLKYCFFYILRLFFKEVNVVKREEDDEDSMKDFVVEPPVTRKVKVSPGSNKKNVKKRKVDVTEYPFTHYLKPTHSCKVIVMMIL